MTLPDELGGLARVLRRHRAYARPVGQPHPARPTPPVHESRDGAVQPYFLGDERPPTSASRAGAEVRAAGGKHNDLDDIGRTNRHLSFFEMLGNFSFGDYFKAEAIPGRWEFVTEVLGLDPERLWVTVH